MEIAWPEIERPRWDARKTASAAMSSGSTNLLIDWLAKASAATSSSDLPLTRALPSNTCWILAPSTAPGREIGLTADHEQGARQNNRAEVSHQPLRRRERKMQWSKKGAHLLLQTRTHTLDGTLHDLFTPWYPAMPANDVQPASFATAA
jgi:hypothetical protein